MVHNFKMISLFGIVFSGFDSLLQFMNSPNDLWYDDDNTENAAKQIVFMRKYI